MTPEQRDLEKFDEGFQEGFQEGLKEAHDNFVLTFITDLQRQGVPAEEIVDRLLKELARK